MSSLSNILAPLLLRMNNLLLRGIFLNFKLRRETRSTPVTYSLWDQTDSSEQVQLIVLIILDQPRDPRCQLRGILFKPKKLPFMKDFIEILIERIRSKWLMMLSSNKMRSEIVLLNLMLWVPQCLIQCQEEKILISSIDSREALVKLIQNFCSSIKNKINSKIALSNPRLTLNHLKSPKWQVLNIGIKKNFMKDCIKRVKVKRSIRNLFRWSRTMLRWESALFSLRFWIQTEISRVLWIVLGMVQLMVRTHSLVFIPNMKLSNVLR